MGNNDQKGEGKVLNELKMRFLLLKVVYWSLVPNLLSPN